MGLDTCPGNANQNKPNFFAGLGGYGVGRGEVRGQSKAGGGADLAKVWDQQLHSLPHPATQLAWVVLK